MSTSWLLSLLCVFIYSPARHCGPRSYSRCYGIGQGLDVTSRLEIKVQKGSEGKKRGKEHRSLVAFGDLSGMVSKSRHVFPHRLFHACGSFDGGNRCGSGCTDGRGNRIHKGHVEIPATVALCLRAPGPRPFVSTSTASNVVIGGSNDCFNGCRLRFLLARVPFPHHSNIHVGQLRMTLIPGRSQESVMVRTNIVRQRS